ncbi:MAG: cupin domain-containing protein [Deltaproteobacteria bacterium]|nr:cupin domain-containing protein [Deltaproteobacteria bacterium]
MPHEEAKAYPKGHAKARHYDLHLQEVQEAQAREAKRRKIIKAQDMPWEDSRQGRLKHLLNEKTDARFHTLDAYIQELPPGGRSGKHRHMAEEVLYILEGKGYDLHWDVDLELGERYSWKVSPEPQRFDWEEGDIVYIPVNTVHQHFNADPARPARFISATNRVYKAVGWDDLEQIEDAPKP